MGKPAKAHHCLPALPCMPPPSAAEPQRPITSTQATQPWPPLPFLSPCQPEEGVPAWETTNAHQQLSDGQGRPGWAGLLQQHSSKASILWCSAFFIVQLSHPYMTTGKTIALTRWTFVGKVMSLLLNMLSRLVITFLPRSKHLLISWLQLPSAVILVGFFCLFVFNFILFLNFTILYWFCQISK